MRMRATRGWQRVAAAAVVAALALVVAACGGSSKSDSSTSSTAAKGGKTLTMWTFKQSNVPGLQAAADAFKQQTGNTVKVEVYTPDDAYATKVRAAAKTRALPDIVSVHSQGEEWAMAQAGILSDITAEFDQQWRAELYPSTVKGTTLTAERIKSSGTDPATTIKDLKPDHFYAVPYLSGTPGIVYASKSKLQAAGVDTSKPPASFEEWVADIGKTVAKSRKTGGLITGLKVPATGYFWLFRPMSYADLGREAFYSRQGKDPSPAWNDPQSVQTLSLYAQLKNLWAPGVLNRAIDEADQEFANGNAAWDVGGTFTLPFLLDQGMSADDLMAFPVPAPSSGAVKQVSLSPSPLVSAGVASTSKNRSEAIAFLKFLSSKQGATLFAQKANDIPATDLGGNGITGNPVLADLSKSISGGGADAFEINDFSADPGGGTNPITAGTADYINKLVAGSATPQQVGDQLATLYRKAWASQKG